MEASVVNPMPRIGDNAPSFTAVTTQGVINFPGDYQGKWKILFSHPADKRTEDYITGRFG